MDVFKKMVRFVREWLYCADRKGHRHALGRLAKHLIPNAGTLIILGLFLLAQSVGAGPSAAPLAQGATTTLLSYQGTLTDKDGNPINGNVEMVFALYHEAEGGTSFWTEAYTGADAVEVRDGQFHVLLGEQAALTPTDLTGDLYLGIQVNGEEMTPRERLTSVVYAVQASHLVTRNTPDVNASSGGIEINDEDGHTLRIDGNELDSTYSLHLQNEHPDKDVVIHSDIDMTARSIVDVAAMTYQGNIIHPASGASPAIRLISQNSVHVFIDSDNNATGQAFTIHRDNNHFAGPVAEIFRVAESGRITAHGQLDMNGNAVTNCGALTEANLQTPEELAADRIDRFSEGDVLCWGDGQLKKCAQAGDPTVQAVADVDGRPIIIGAEVIKVIGPVKQNDFLVTSDVPGYAMVNNDPRPGTVIAQALEDFHGEQGLVKAMIRKF